MSELQNYFCADCGKPLTLIEAQSYIKTLDTTPNAKPFCIEHLTERFMKLQNLYFFLGTNI